MIGVLTGGAAKSTEGVKFIQKAQKVLDKVKGKLHGFRKGAGCATRGGLLDDAANFAQLDYSEAFSGKGIKMYSDLAGKQIVTIDDLVDAIQSGAIDPSKLQIDIIQRGQNTLILNTRTSEALRRAGIPRSRWNAVNRTGDDLFESLLDGQLGRNHLDDLGTQAPTSQGIGL